MSKNKSIQKNWYLFFKKKYKISDDDIDEYIDSFRLINNGNIVTANILAKFINRELNNDKYNIERCSNIIYKINLIIHNKKISYLDLTTYLIYIIPLCQKCIINRIGIKQLFDSLDSNQDGKINCQELISILYKINRNFSPNDIKKYTNEIKKICIKVDIDNNGFISFDEFKNFMDTIITP